MFGVYFTSLSAIVLIIAHRITKRRDTFEFHLKPALRLVFFAGFHNYVNASSKYLLRRVPGITGWHTHLVAVDLVLA
jgi:hypothetical protein